jgi:hypothetical protein
MAAAMAHRTGFISLPALAMSLLAGCLEPVGPAWVTDEGLAIELILPDTVKSGDAFTLTTRLRNDGLASMVLSGGWCPARYTLRVGSQEVRFSGTGRTLACGAAVWRWTLAVGETRDYEVQTFADPRLALNLPATIRVGTELFMTLHIEGQTRDLRDRDLRGSFSVVAAGQ